MVITVPAGTVVGTIYSIHHNKAYFSKPFDFVPERWIHDPETDSHTVSESKADALVATRSAFYPFSIGPGGCIGKGLAYTGMMTALARTVCLYDMSGERRQGWWWEL